MHHYVIRGYRSSSMAYYNRMMHKPDVCTSDLAQTGEQAARKFFLSNSGANCQRVVVGKSGNLPSHYTRKSLGMESLQQAIN